jgi:hypothetical protein
LPEASLLDLRLGQAAAFFFGVKSFVREKFTGAPETNIGGLVNTSIHHRNVNIVAEAGATGADSGFDSCFQ